jgi:hypothetical protein
MDPGEQKGKLFCFGSKTIGGEFSKEDLEYLEPDDNDDPETGIIYKEYLDRHEVAKDFRRNYTELWHPKPKDLHDHRDFVVQTFASQYRINYRSIVHERWRIANLEDYNKINEIIAHSELKKNTKVAIDGGYFEMDSSDNFIFVSE